MKKKLAFLLALAMALALVPTIALAAGTTLRVGPGEAYTTIQSAIDAAGTGTTEILIKTGTYSETLQILQQADKNIILTGEDGAIFKGNVIIDGNGRSAGAETVTFRNLQFDKSGTTFSAHVYIVDMKKFVSTSYSYTHNVTFENCAFIGDDSGEYTFAINAGSSGGNTAYNTAIRNCTFKNLDCAIQARCQGITLENVTITDVYGGINANNSSNITLLNVKISAKEYALRLGENSGIANNGYTNITNSVLNCPSTKTGEGAIVLRVSAQVALTITGSDIIGSVVNASPNTVSLTSSDAYWGNSLIGFTEAQLNIQSNSPAPHYGDTDVIASVDPVYIIIIPASVNFGTLVNDSGLVKQDFDIIADSVLVEDGASIDVAVASAFVMKDENGAGTTLLPYSLFNTATGGTALVNGDSFATFTADGTKDGRVEVDTSRIAKAGSYQGTMVFTVSYLE